MKKYILVCLMLVTTATYAQNPADAQKMQEMGKIMQKVQQQMKANPNMTKQEQQELMMQMMNQSKLGQNILKEQKEKMPKILKILKSNRACFGKADTKSDAKECAKQSAQMAKRFGMKDNFEQEIEKDLEWNKDIKKEALADMDRGIKEISAALPCIQSAKSMSDMTKCHQQ
jgi:hypothetical protein